MSERTVKVRSKTLHTPIWEYGHESTASRISLVGMIHVGMQSYYDEVADHVATTESQGNVVHYEMIKKTDGEDGEVLPEDASRLMELSDSMKIPVELISKHVNGVLQREALEYKPHWENHDISKSEFINRLGPDALEKLLEGMKKFKELDEENPQLAGQLLRGALRAMPLLTRFHKHFGDKHTNDIILHHRNFVATEAVEKRIAAEPDAGITMLWGSNHLPGIGHRLESLGYKRSSVRWLGAVSLAKSHV